MAETITKEAVIGDILEKKPEARAVIEKYFGMGCFTCPGMKMESIGFGAMMHGVDPEEMVREINALNGAGA